MKKIIFIITLAIALLFTATRYGFAFNMPSGWIANSTGGGGRLDNVVVKKYSVSIISIIAIYSDSTTAVIYSNSSGSTAKDIAGTTAGTNGEELLSAINIPAGTITSLQIVFSNNFIINGYQNYSTETPREGQEYTTSSTPAGNYYSYWYESEVGWPTPIPDIYAQEVAVDVSAYPISASLSDRTVTISNLNIVITKDTAKNLRLVFNLSSGIIFGWDEAEESYTIAVPGTPTISSAEDI